MLDVAYADLVADTESTMRRVFDCGLPFAPEALDGLVVQGDVATASTASVRRHPARSRRRGAVCAVVAADARDALAAGG